MLYSLLLSKLTVGLSWDKAKGKSVKSIDKKDIGKIKEISQDYIQIKKGIVDKEYFFVPKYFVEGYDQDDIIVSLTEDEIKTKFFNKSNPSKEMGKIKSVGQSFVEVEDGVISKKHYFIPKKYIHQYDGDTIYSSLEKEQVIQKYQRDSPPLESELQDIEKGEEYELIPFMAKEPGLEIKTERMDEELKVPWEEIIHKHVRTTDNIDIGDVDKVGNEFIVVREGFAHVHLYYIPKKYIIKYDGSSLWLNLSSTTASSKFERKNEPSEEEMEALLNQ